MLTIREEPASALTGHAGIAIAFQVSEVLDLSGVHVGQAAAAYRRTPVPEPWQKDYDAIAGNHPSTWPHRLGLTEWSILGAFDDGARIGGVVVALDNPAVHLINGSLGDAILWDIRVAASHRGRGTGSALFAKAEAWARGRGCSTLRAETQDINVAACLFYARCGCVLERVRHGAYPGLPNEVQLIWSKAL